MVVIQLVQNSSKVGELITEGSEFQSLITKE